jgi:hypothetical protein
MTKHEYQASIGSRKDILQWAFLQYNESPFQQDVIFQLEIS